MPKQVRIKQKLLSEEFGTSSGPGGQNVNKRSTAVDLRYDFGSDSAFDEVERARIREAKALPGRVLKGDILLINASDERTQQRNRKIAMGRLRDRLEAAYVVPKRRKPTKPTRTSKRRRVSDKRYQSKKKELRKNPKPRDW